MTPQALGAAAEAAEHGFEHPPMYMVFARPEAGLHQVFLHDNNHAYLSGDGRTVATWKGTGRPEVWVYELHHYLLASETGMKVAGCTSSEHLRQAGSGFNGGLASSGVDI